MSGGYASVVMLCKDTIERYIKMSDKKVIVNDMPATDLKTSDFYYDLPEGEYVGLGGKKKQFNQSCYLHD